MFIIERASKQNEGKKKKFNSAERDMVTVHTHLLVLSLHRKKSLKLCYTSCD